MSSSVLAKRIQTLSPSATLAVDAVVKKLEREGTKILNLSLGEPDFKTPENIQNAAVTAMREGYTHYTQTAGIPELRTVISEKFRKENSIDYDPSEIVVGVGSKQLLYHAMMALCGKDDEVLVPTPTWSTYVEQIRLAEATPVCIQLQPPFRLRAQDIEKHITPRTKAIILNSPSNPTGAVIGKEELQKIGDLAVKHNFWIIADEIYEKLLYGGVHVSVASLSDAIRARTITINGFSKSYAMTGWRIGYAGGPKEVITAMVNLQSQTTSNTSSIAQYAAVEAITGDQKSLGIMKQEFEKRREYLLDEFSRIPNLKVVEPDGAFYLFIHIEASLHTGMKT
ncbi:MAG: hypothetical protein RLZZ455_1214, partial [Candidatus Parcubacteria bacterium]